MLTRPQPVARPHADCDAIYLVDGTFAELLEAAIAPVDVAPFWVAMDDCVPIFQALPQRGV